MKPTTTTMTVDPPPRSEVFNGGSAAELAVALRGRAAAGEPVDSAELAAAEAAERVEQLRAHGAQVRAVAEAASAEADRLAAERAEVQAAWQQLHDPTGAAVLDRLSDDVERCVIAYLSAVRQQADHWSAVVDRASAAGFRVDQRLPATLADPVPALAALLNSQAARLLPTTVTTIEVVARDRRLPGGP